MPSRNLAAGALTLLGLALGCAAPSSRAADGARPTAQTASGGTDRGAADSTLPPREPSDESEQYEWQKETHSPHPSQPDPHHRTLLDKCGRADAALNLVAARVARRQLLDLPDLDIPEISFALRAAGSPYVWARAWSVESKALSDDDVLERMERWLGSFDDGGERRCGIGRATNDQDQTVVAALALDAVADLERLPTRARVGQWLSVEARVLKLPKDAQVVLLGPRGAPRSVMTSVDGKTVRARFAPNRPGSWLVQVLADVGSGPRPVAEAMVHVDTEPPTSFRGTPAPGEQAGHGAADDRVALEKMVNAVRKAEGLRRLRRKKSLDALAQQHAEAMREAGRIGHDVGTGSLPARIQAASLTVSLAGENLARAMDIGRAHRALWASPSHRGNLLHTGFDSVGIGVVHDEDGTVWVCQVFAAF